MLSKFIKYAVYMNLKTPEIYNEAIKTTILPINKLVIENLNDNFFIVMLQQNVEIFE